MSITPRLRSASPNDKRAIEILLNYKDRIHRHLDWRSPIDLLGEQPYFVIERDYAIQAALACPEDPPDVAWIRFFGTVPGMPLLKTWSQLFAQVLESFSRQPEHIVSISIQTWYLRMLLDAGFSLHQTIVVLYLNTPAVMQVHSHEKLLISPMLESELEKVMAVDHTAFDPIWRYSLADLRSAYQNSDYATIARIGNRMIGYQISSANPLNAHLARLAVLPEMQGQQIGSALTLDMVKYFNKRGIGYITVNTQSDNTASLKLYRKLGFEMSNEKFPVLIYQG